MGTQSCCCGVHFENHGAHRSLEEEGLNLREGCSDREEVHGKEPQVLRPRGREGAAREEGDQQAHQAESFHHARNRSYFACGSLQGKESHLLEAASIRTAPSHRPIRRQRGSYEARQPGLCHRHRDYLANQKAMDTALTPIIGKTKDLEAYLKAHFSLKDGDRPHLMKF